MLPAMTRPLLVLVLAGCNGSIAPALDATTHEVTGEAGQVFDARDESLTVANPTVCVLDHPEVDCAIGAADGTYTLGVPDNLLEVDLAQIASAAGRLSMVQLDHNSTAETSWWASMYTWADADIATVMTDAGFTYPATKTGYVHLDVVGAGGEFVGASATLTPASGLGPVYADPDARPDPALGATTSSGEVWFGDVTPGKYAIEVTAPGVTCGAAFQGDVILGNWPPTGAGSVAFEVAPAALTDRISVYCN